MKNRISVTEAVRNFADFINRVVYRGEHFVLERGERPVARLVPVPQAGRLGELLDLLGVTPRLSPEEAAAMARDLGTALDEMRSLNPEGPWES